MEAKKIKHIKQYEDRVLEREMQNAKRFNPLYGKYRNLSQFELEKELQIGSRLEDDLEVRRTFRKAQEEEFKDRWTRTENKIKSLQDIFPKFEEYFKACHQKRQRSLKRYEKEKAEIQSMTHEINRLKREKALLAQIKVSQVKRLEILSPIRTYLEEERDLSEGAFKEPSDFLERYQILKDEREDLLSEGLGKIERLMECQKIVQGFQEGKSSEHMTLSNYKTELDGILSKLKDKSSEMDGKLWTLKISAQDRGLVTSQLKMAIYGLYLQFCQSMGRTPEIESDQCVQQLLFLHKYLGDLIRLSKEIRGAVEGTGTEGGVAHDTERERRNKLEAYKERTLQVFQVD